MRKLFSISTAASLLMMLTNIGHAQLAVGVRGGLNISKLAGDVITESKVGLIAGAFVGIGLSGNWGMQPELSYVQKGTKREVQGGELTGTTKLDYLELQVPINVDLPVKSERFNPRLQAGPTFAAALSCKVEETGPSDTESEDCMDDIESYDIGIVLGFGLDIGSGPGAFIADIRYNIGLTNINDAVDEEGNPEPFALKNRSTQLLVGYRRKF